MQTVYLNQNYEGTIICKSCGRWKTQTFPPGDVANKPLKVKCRCGAIFDIMREMRKAYRKSAYLQATYRHEGVSDAERVIEIADISQGGLRLHASACHNLQVDDTLNLTFILDDKTRAKIHKAVQVKHIRDRIVGTQFSPEDEWAYRKELGFYLMPT